ncbi:hypothetical protein D9756_010735 [Leucocoprinus leucothites]|uniref:Uncharacterized protein n=1 Tax=Leucocoprinus leucothites TaxID=201217 RepID=A0A8H5CX12_9AGAR|nr:hypothetical protein D9756_010735 [Leucoagaricus leucothites]
MSFIDFVIQLFNTFRHRRLFLVQRREADDVPQGLQLSVAVVSVGPIEDGFQISSHDFVAVFFGISCLFFADSECIVAIKKLRNTRLRGPSLFLAATDRYTVVKSGKGLIVFCGSMRAARIHPLMLGSHLSLFKGGGYITFTTATTRDDNNSSRQAQALIDRNIYDLSIKLPSIRLKVIILTHLVELNYSLDNSLVVNKPFGTALPLSVASKNTFGTRNRLKTICPLKKKAAQCRNDGPRSLRA